jgi:hypothetical protein
VIHSYLGSNYDVSADGQRFLVNTLLDENSAEPPTLLVNWPAPLRRYAPPYWSDHGMIVV